MYNKTVDIWNANVWICESVIYEKSANRAFRLYKRKWSNDRSFIFPRVRPTKTIDNRLVDIKYKAFYYLISTLAWCEFEIDTGGPIWTQKLLAWILNVQALVDYKRSLIEQMFCKKFRKNKEIPILKWFLTCHLKKLNLPLTWTLNKFGIAIKKKIEPAIFKTNIWICHFIKKIELNWFLN